MYMMVILRILNLYCTTLKPVEDDEIDYKKKNPKSQSTQSKEIDSNKHNEKKNQDFKLG